MYSYDPEKLIGFSYKNREFTYEGLMESNPEGSIQVSDRIENEIMGCAFLSGQKDNIVVLNGSRVVGFGIKNNPWVGVCGTMVKSPKAVAGLCKMRPGTLMYVCSIVDELAAFGALVSEFKELPRRVSFLKQNKEVISADSMEFDLRLPDDGMGRMADAVAQGLYVVNQTMSSIGIPIFYGMTLSREWLGTGHVIVRGDVIDKFFPNTPISAKYFAATTVPVSMSVSGEFRKVSGYNGKVIDVVVANEAEPGLDAFMSFYKAISKREFVFVTKDVQHRDIVPVFRFDRAYRVKKEKYEQT
jgi:hypothetical protein